MIQPFVVHRQWALAAALSFLVGTAAGCGFGSASVDELIITDIKVGDGKEAMVPKSVSAHYTGWLYDPSKEGNRGARFDSSHDRGLPFTFTLGQGQVIKGWEEGIPGMKVGGVRELIIPADKAYGDKVAAQGKIPSNSTLVFEIQLVIVRK